MGNQAGVSFDERRPKRRGLRMAGEAEGARRAGSTWQRAGGHRGRETGWAGVVSPEDSGASRAGQRCSVGGGGGLRGWGQRVSGGGGELRAGGDSQRRGTGVAAQGGGRTQSERGKGRQKG